MIQNRALLTIISTPLFRSIAWVTAEIPTFLLNSSYALIMRSQDCVAVKCPLGHERQTFVEEILLKSVACGMSFVMRF